MKILSVKKQEHSLVFEVELDAKAWKKAFNNEKNRLAKNIQIPGFRKGHVPANLIEERINPNQVAYEALNRQNEPMVKEIMETKEFKDSDCLDAVSSLDIVKLDADKAPIVKVGFDLVPQVSGFEAKDVEKIEVAPFKDDVPAGLVDQQIRQMIKNDAMVSEKKEQVVANGDIAVINFKGFVDDKAFAGGEAKKFELEIGSKSFIDNFEEQLIGCKKGDKKDVNVKFPENYQSKDLAGKKAKFEVEVLGVKEIEYPEINKEYLAKFKIDAENKTELKKYIKNLFVEEAKMRYQDYAMQVINAEISKKIKLDYYPESLISMHKNQILNQYNEEAKKYGFKDLNAYKKALNLDDAKFEQVINDSAKSCLALTICYEKFITDLKLEVEAKDKKDYINKLTRYIGGNAKQAEEMYEKNKDYCESTILKDKLFKHLVDSAKKVEPKAELKEDKEAKAK